MVSSGSRCLPAKKEPSPFWKESDGDQLLLCPGEEPIWYYAHEQDKVKRLCGDMTELLEKKLARYLNEH